MKKTALAAVAVLAVTAGSMNAYAQDAAAPAAAASAPDASPITYNIGVVSDYRYRGISQSKLKPALQGGIDIATKGFVVDPGDHRADAVASMKDGIELSITKKQVEEPPGRD